MRRLWLLPLLVFLLGHDVPVRAAGDIAGTYGCAGANPDGSPYTSSLEVAAEGDAWTLTWTLPSGASHEGIGLVTGEVLSVIYTTGSSVGLASYAISKTALTGRWTAPGAAGLVMTETCTVGGQAAPA